MNKMERIALELKRNSEAEDYACFDTYLPNTCRDILREVTIYLADLADEQFSRISKRLAIKGIHLDESPPEEILARASLHLDAMEKYQPVSFRHLSIDIDRCSHMISDNRLFLDGHNSIDGKAAASLYQDINIEEPDNSYLWSHINVLVLTLTHLIVYTARIENQMLKASPSLPFEYITQQLNPFISKIFNTYLSLKASEPGLELLKTNIKIKMDKSKAGSTSSKKPIFDGFNLWITNLPESHTFRYTKDAAKYYLESILKAENPDLYKKKSSTTIRTMGEKLAQYCETNNLKHPISGRN